MPQTVKSRNSQSGGTSTALAAPEQRTGKAPERWQPFGDFEPLAERMRRLLEQTFGELAWPTPTFEPIGWSPLVDIEEQDDAYLIEAELPGVRKEDVKVEVVGNELLITGELTETERKGVIRKRMRPTGRFHYQVALPASVTADKVEAKLHDGVLEIRVPKIEKAARRQIQVKALVTRAGAGHVPGPAAPGKHSSRRRGIAPFQSAPNH